MARAAARPAAPAQPPGGASGSGTGGTTPSDGPSADTPAPSSDTPTAPPPGKCDYTPKPNATGIKLRFETIALMGVSTADINKGTGSKDGITEMKFVPGRPNELLLLQKRGKLNHLRLEPGATMATLVKAYDITVATGTDCGLISLAFDPDFASNKLIYVGLCTGASASKLVRYKWDADALTDPVDIMTWSLPSGPGYHSIGSMGFDAQGVMWILHGELYTGPQAQNLNTNLGKLLRIIPSRTPAQGGYIPAPDNPFAADAKPRSAIYAWGLRSPWRGVLTAKGHWVIGDVQDQMNEEVNVVTGKGQNFGWPGSSGACAGTCATPVTYYRRSQDPYEGQGNEVKEGRQGRAVWVGAQYGDCGNDRYRGALTGVRPVRRLLCRLGPRHGARRRRQDDQGREHGRARHGLVHGPERRRLPVRHHARPLRHRRRRARGAVADAAAVAGAGVRPVLTPARGRPPARRTTARARSRRSAARCWMAGKARCSQSVRSHSRQVTPTGTAASRVVEVDAVGVDELPGVAHLAAEADGLHRVRGVVAAAILAQRAGDAEVGGAVGHLRELRADHARRQEGGVHVPARAGAGEAREADARGR